MQDPAVPSSGPHPAADAVARGVDRQVRILVVDDEPPIVELVTGYLAREGWAVTTAADGPAALALARRLAPDVVVLDLMLPGLDGLEVCRELRAFSDAYVLMVTARSEEIDRIVGLAVGADDYLTKPFSPRELVARIKALLRRPRLAGSGTAMPAASAGPGAPAPGLRVDEGRRSVSVDGREIELTVIEFDILAALAREPGIVMARPRIFATVWGDDDFADDHLVDVHVANLRRKLGDDAASPRFVETVRGVGYRLREAR